MRKYFVVVVVLWQVCAGIAFAQSAAPIHELRATVLTDAYLFASDDGSGVESSSRGQDDLRRLLPPALAAAGNHADLKSSIKAFYVAAQTYFDSALTPVPLPSYDSLRNEMRASPEEIQLKAAQAKLKADLDSKANAMQLEAQLVGMDG